MVSHCSVVHVDDISPESMDANQGWSISEFRIPISRKQGSSTTAFHSRFFPGSTHKKHRHDNCEEIAVYLRGRGVVGNGPDRAQLRPGLCRLIPVGVDHFYFNATQSEPAEVLGFYIGAGGLDDTGYVYTGDVTKEDLEKPRKGISQGIVVHFDDVPPEHLNSEEGWPIGNFRLPLSKRNGSTTTLFRASFLPGSIHQKHRFENCEEIYYVMNGRGLAGAGSDRVEVCPGHFHYIPKGVEHWLHNPSGTETLETLGIYIGAASVEDTGYVYTGDVTQEDLMQRA